MTIVNFVVVFLTEVFEFIKIFSANFEALLHLEICVINCYISYTVIKK